jgi:hypothetical protein
MPSLPHSGRRLAAILVLGCIALLGLVNVGWADTSHARHLTGHRRHRAQVQAQVTRLHRTHTHHHGNTPPPASPSGSAAGSSSSGGSSPSSGASNPTPTPPIAPNPIAESPAPTPSPAPSPQAFQPGLNSDVNMTLSEPDPNPKLDIQGAALLGAKLVRVAFPIDTAPARMEAVIAGYAADGIRVLPLATFGGTLPTPAEAQNLADWATMYGPGGTFWAGRSDGQLAIQSIEFGNETSYGYQYGDAPGDRSFSERAENYARRLREAAEAISTTGVHVGLLAQADDWTGDWVNGMYAAVPNLSDYVAGWTIHPYHNWIGRLEDLLEQLAAHGAPATIPIDITEWGLPNDNGACLSESGCPTYGHAATALRAAVAEIRQFLGNRLAMFMLYQIRDERNTGASTDSEYYYGVLQRELQPKGEFTTAVQELLASS